MLHACVCGINRGIEKTWPVRGRSIEDVGAARCLVNRCLLTRVTSGYIGRHNRYWTIGKLDNTGRGEAVIEESVVLVANEACDLIPVVEPGAGIHKVRGVGNRPRHAVAEGEIAFVHCAEQAVLGPIEQRIAETHRCIGGIGCCHRIGVRVLVANHGAAGATDAVGFKPNLPVHVVGREERHVLPVPNERLKVAALIS